MHFFSDFLPFARNSLLLQPSQPFLVAKLHREQLRLLLAVCKKSVRFIKFSGAGVLCKHPQHHLPVSGNCHVRQHPLHHSAAKALPPAVGQAVNTNQLGILCHLLRAASVPPRNAVRLFVDGEQIAVADSLLKQPAVGRRHPLEVGASFQRFPVQNVGKGALPAFYLNHRNCECSKSEH